MAATLGSSHGVKLVDDAEFHNPIRYKALKDLSPKRQLSILEENLNAAGVRYPNRKALQLRNNLERIINKPRGSEGD